MAKDVAAFLVWTAEPNLESRRAAGFAVVVFLLLATILGYFAYPQLWHEAKRKVRPTGPLDPENQAKTRRAKAKAGDRRLRSKIRARCRGGGSVEERAFAPVRSCTCPRRIRTGVNAYSLYFPVGRGRAGARRLRLRRPRLGLGYGGGYGGYGYGSPYYGYGYGSPYYGGGYGYGAGYGSYYGSSFGSPFGWYDNYYYPGSGYYVYDTYRRPHVMTTTQRTYWTRVRRHCAASGTRTDCPAELERLQPSRTRPRRAQRQQARQERRNGHDR